MRRTLEEVSGERRRVESKGIGGLVIEIGSPTTSERQLCSKLHQSVKPESDIMKILKKFTNDPKIQHVLQDSSCLDEPCSVTVILGKGMGSGMEEARV
ncbi:hypothetical protein PoB_003682700 [Plakobranchus ocellatus]|uniref:Uncharacterized protein n=1 Tax=Plakobranchus ocellatus TaxID=259542 RepID=A0AAV4ATR3_9GAST|nr:hypothetical protein PoB_003682700 [Plakobranchus ocellatus]